MEGELPASQEQPSTSREQPSTSQERPSASREQPSTSQEQPSTSREQPSTSQNQPSLTPSAGPNTSQGLQLKLTSEDLSWDPRTLPHGATLCEEGRLFCNHKLGDLDPRGQDPLHFPGAASRQTLGRDDTAYWHVHVQFERGRRRCETTLCAVGVATGEELASSSHHGEMPRFEDGAFLVRLNADWDRKYLKLSAHRGNQQLEPLELEEALETEGSFSITLGFAFQGPQGRVTVTQPRGEDLGVAWSTDWGVGQRCRVMAYVQDWESCDEVIEVRLLPSSRLTLHPAQLQQLSAIFQ